MSDEEYEYSDDSGGAGSGSEEEENDVLIDIENAYYEGDDCKNDDTARAREMFEKVVTLEEDHGSDIKWRFKALEQLVLLLCRTGDASAMITRYQQMIAYIANSSVTRNESTSAINNVLEAVSGSGADSASLSKVYEVTLTTLRQSAQTLKLWFATYVRYGKACLASRDYTQLRNVLAELHKSCESVHAPGGSEADVGGNRQTNLLEVYALEIQWHSDTKNVHAMKLVYPKTLNLDAAVADPRVMGVIREEGGKMYMSEGKWSEAYNEFYESFRGYQEAGNPRAKDALKYVVLANMLALSDINPFAAREAKAYQEEKEIVAITTLRAAYEANDLTSFERALENKAYRILEDPFMATYVSPLRRRMKEQVLLNLVKPYHRIRLQFLQDELKVGAVEVEGLLVDMILDKRVLGRIDQIQGFLLLDQASTSVKTKNYDALMKWSTTLGSLAANLNAKITI